MRGNDNLEYISHRKLLSSVRIIDNYEFPAYQCSVTKRSKVKIYTDGGCDVNPGGTGGWAFLIIPPGQDRVIERSGREERSTNNRMELTAALRALESLESSSEVELFTDSQYLARGMTQWIHNWVRSRWTLKDGSPVKNSDLWKRLSEASKRHRVTWTWVRGHKGDPYNVRVDRLVKEAIKGKIAAEVSSVEEMPSPPPEVKVIKRRGKPVAVAISVGAGAEGKTYRLPPMKVKVEHLQKLVEDLVAALREVEES